jgi:hypothetical protein
MRPKLQQKLLQGLPKQRQRRPKQRGLLLQFRKTFKPLLMISKENKEKGRPPKKLRRKLNGKRRKEKDSQD